LEKNLARFFKPMECLPVEKIPEGDNWTYELKLDGYRLQAVKAGGKVILYSRRGIDLTKRFEYVTKALASLPDDTVIDGELVALALDQTWNRSCCIRFPAVSVTCLRFG
jgi:bifunctional non-homologous end joining protein LigD